MELGGSARVQLEVAVKGRHDALAALAVVGSRFLAGQQSQSQIDELGMPG